MPSQEMLVLGSRETGGGRDDVLHEEILSSEAADRLLAQEAVGRAEGRGVSRATAVVLYGLR